MSYGYGTGCGYGYGSGGYGGVVTVPSGAPVGPEMGPAPELPELDLALEIVTEIAPTPAEEWEKAGRPAPAKPAPAKRETPKA